MANFQYGTNKVHNAEVLPHFASFVFQDIACVAGRKVESASFSLVYASELKNNAK